MQPTAQFRKFPALFVTLFLVARVESVVLGPALGTLHEVSRGDLLVSELNCVTCHEATADQAVRLASRKAPKLGVEGLRITPQYLRRFLSDPLASKPGTTMPDLLHGLGVSEKSEVVESLVHFLISEQSSEAEQGIGAEDYLLRQGQSLYHTIGCVACHEPQVSSEMSAISPESSRSLEVDASLKGTASVPLGDLARKTTVDQLARFLVDPLKTRPSGRMPSHNLTRSEATSIAVYLLRAQAAGSDDPSKRALVAGLKYQYYEENFPANPDFQTLTPRSSGTIETFSVQPMKRDQQFGFRFSGSIRISKAGRYTFFTNSDDGSQLFIDGKLVVNNNGDHAPQEKRGSIELTEGEHSIEVTFYNNGAGYEFDVLWRGPGFEKQRIPGEVLSHLSQPMIPIDNEPFTVDREKVGKGRDLFRAFGCAVCHEISGQGVTKVAAAKALSDLTTGAAGCLAERPNEKAAKFDLSDEERRLLAEAIEMKRFNRQKSESEQVAQTMAQLNCYACHTRDGKGGPSDARLAYFRMNGDVDMGDEGRVPPHLTGVGAKLKADWTKQVLLTGGRVRPYMGTRMPQFGEANIGHLPEVFERADLRNESKAPEFSIRDAKFGRRLTGTGGLACISCHTVANYKSLGIPAIDLTMMASRLRYDWFHRYLIDPPSLRPGTRMPSFWPGGESVNTEILEGNTESQVIALWAYLNSKVESDLPPGLVQGKKEIVAETEPVIYRNFIQGGGTRAIGVGYPEKVNLAFDADQQRLAMIWQGPFIDGSRHSSGRGEGFEPPLGNNILNMPEGPEFALLDSRESPWPKTTGHEAGFRMRGYTLDSKRRPTFRYQFSELQIEEKFEPVMGEIDAHFKRTLTIKGTGPDNVWFRAAAGDLRETGGTFILNNKVQMKFSGARPVLRDIDGTKELVLPVKLENGSATITQEIIW